MDVAALASASQTTPGAAPRLAANFDTFLKLLTTQLRNQDPLDPLDTDKFTEQLVQFSAVEQSIETNSHLEALIALQAATARDSAISLVGRTATVATSTAMNAGGATWTYTLPGGAETVTLAIVDDKGRPVAAFDGETGAGAHALVWDGKTASGDDTPAGLYRLIVAAKGPGGGEIEAAIETLLRVDAVSFRDGATKLETAAGFVNPADILRIAAGS